MLFLGRPPYEIDIVMISTPAEQLRYSILSCL